jgi:ribosomal protein L37AE/L43A
MVVGYGKKIREKISEIENKKKKAYLCPLCSRMSVEYISKGVWSCKRCKKRFASDAYEFTA